MKILIVLILSFSFVFSQDYSKLNESQLLKIAKTIPAKEYKKNIAIYQELYKKSNFKNQRYREKLKYYGKKLQESYKKELLKNRLDFKTCDDYLAHYNKYLYRYVNVVKTLQEKKIAIYMTKSYQDDLLKGCRGVIDISRVVKMENEVEQGYEIFY